MYIGIDWSKELTDQAKACGCNEPWLHASDTFHKACYDLSRAWMTVVNEFINTLPAPIARLLRRSA